MSHVTKCIKLLFMCYQIVTCYQMYLSAQAVSSAANIELQKENNLELYIYREKRKYIYIYIYIYV